jgi:putative SOS response-associated peptidase YedK
MCGKFTAMASWVEATTLAGAADSTSDAGNDGAVTYRVMNALPVIVWDRDTKQRRVMPMRWGFPHRADPRRPDPIHARAETIDEKPSFRDAFHDGQRGIVMVRTFNEARELAGGKSEQHTITTDGAAGIALVWRRFGNLIACVMVTVPANTLIGAISDRMPAVLAPEDWAIWLGEEPASHDRIKACLKTVEDVRWSMTPEERASKPRRKPTQSDPGGLF